MVNEFVVVVSSLVILFSSATQNSLSGQSRRRDLTLYEKAGPYTIGFGLHGNPPDKILAEIRMFLWEHWKEHRAGYLLATFYSKEGEPSQNEFFVEPDSKGHWQITVETDRVISKRQPGDKRLSREKIESIYVLVERIEPPRDGLSSPKLLTNEEVRKPHMYRLRLTGRGANEQIVL